MIQTADHTRQKILFDMQMYLIESLISNSTIHCVGTLVTREDLHLFVMFMKLALLKYGPFYEALIMQNILDCTSRLQSTI